MAPRSWSLVVVCLLSAAACGPQPREHPGDDGGDDTGPPDAGGPVPDADPTPNSCDQDLHGLTNALPPQFLIILDRSGSMDAIWPPVITGIAQVVTSSSADVRWGLSYFPSGETAADQCTTGPVTVPVGLGQAGAISASVNATYPAGLTPTWSAIDQAAAYWATVTAPNPKYNLLVTDGYPNCAAVANCNCPPGFAQNGANQCYRVGGDPYDYYTCDIPGDISLNASYWALANLDTAGVPTFVFGLAWDNVTEYTLNLLADAGGEARPTVPKYYPVDDPAELNQIIADLAIGLTECTFELPDTMGRPLLGIELDGVNVPHDPTHMSGWDLDSSGRVRLYGAWCDAVSTATSVVGAFECPPQE